MGVHPKRDVSPLPCVSVPSGSSPHGSAPLVALVELGAKRSDANLVPRAGSHPGHSHGGGQVVVHQEVTRRDPNTGKRPSHDEEEEAEDLAQVLCAGVLLRAPGRC